MEQNNQVEIPAVTHSAVHVLRQRNEKFDDVMLTVQDVQQVFGCGRRQAYELMAIQGFPAMKIGRKYFVSAKALTKWIQKNTEKTIRK